MIYPVDEPKATALIFRSGGFVVAEAKSETDLQGAFANLFEAFGGLGIAKSPGQDVRYVVVDHSVPDENVTEVRFTVRVNKTALDPLLPFDVRLYRFVDGTAVPVSTTLIDQTDEVYVFEAVSPGLSVFAVGADLGGQLEIEVSPDQTAIEGDPVTVDIEMNSSFAPEDLSVTIDWGDGTTEPLAVVGTEPDLFASGEHTFRDDGQFAVEISVEGGAVALLRSTNVTVSNAPPVMVAGDDRTSTEGAPVTLAASFADPGVEDAPWTVSWDFGDGTEPTTVTADARGDVETDHVYVDNGDYVAEVCVSDKDGDTGCDSLEVTVLNVAPTVSATADAIDEGETATVRATVTDPGVLDTHAAMVDWGDGTPPESVAIEQGAGSGSLTAEHTYGDDGDYSVTVTVTDDDGGVGTMPTVIDVSNVVPTVGLNADGVIPFHGGDAFHGRLGVEQTHTADATDQGSDDLDFAWDFEVNTSNTTYFNDGQGPDPPLSPDGAFPFAATDTARVTFDAPGVYTGSVTVTDDDGGTAEANLSKVVTGDTDDVRGRGFWRHQYSGKGRAHYDGPMLTAFLDIAEYGSPVFSESVNAGTIDGAHAVLAVGDDDDNLRANANAQLLAAWLNFAAGGVGWDEQIDTGDDALGRARFGEVVAEVETILMDPNATHDQIERAKDLAEAINEHTDEDGDDDEDDEDREDRGDDEDDEDREDREDDEDN